MLAAVIMALLAFIVLSFHSTVAVAASTLAAAALFTPLRRIDLTGVVPRPGTRPRLRLAQPSRLKSVPRSPSGRRSMTLMPFR